MTYLMLRVEVPDFDTWKRELFDPDPAARAQAAKSHRIYRGVENRNELIVQVEFSSAEQAKSFRERLLGTGVLEDPRAGKTPAPPIVVEEEEAVAY
jgi:hypothetical protein